MARRWMKIRRRAGARRSVGVVTAASLLVLGLAGCGTNADADQARRAAQTLYVAAARHDGSRACAQMSPSLRAQLVDDDGGPCAKAVVGLDLAGRTVDEVKVYADAALVRFTGGDTVFLGDTAQGWRVEALGCRPQGHGPYDCEEQA
jgi:outer membrane murein-binding lipoprotein Lpp